MSRRSRSSRLLLDTHALLFWLADDPALPRGVRQKLAAPETEVFVSAASLWEIAIKTRRGRLTGLSDYLTHHAELHREWGLLPVTMSLEDAVVAGSLPTEHTDPFDRMLVAQATRLDALLVTRDAAIRAFCKRTYWD